MSKRTKDLVKIIQAKTGHTLEQVAKVLNYSRPHLSKMLNSDEPDDELYDLVRMKFGHCLEDEDTKKPEVNGDFQARFINRLDDDLKEMKTRLLILEKMLSELQASLQIAHTRQKASFAITYLIAEELGTVPKNEKDRARLTSETRKKIESRLLEVKPGDK